MALYNSIYNVDNNTGKNISTMGTGGGNATTNYYSSLANPVVNTTTGQINNGVAKDAVVPQLNAGAAWRNQILNMPAGTKQGTSPNLAGMPDWLRNQYSQVDTSTAEGGYQNLWNMPGLAMTDKNGKQVIMLDDNGNLIDSSSRALNDNFDFKTMGRYDPDLGWVTDIENTNDSPWQAHLRQSRMIAGGALAAMGGAAALTGGVGGLAGSAADVAVPANLPALAPTTVGSLGPAAEIAGTGAGASGLGSYAGMSTGLDGASGAGLSVGTPVNSAAGVNAAAGTTAATAAANGIAGTGLSIGDILKGGLNLASIFGQRGNTAAYNNSMNNAANMANPFGPYREQAIQNLLKLINDPSSVTKTPGYQFRLSQGEQGVNRNAAASGYFRSGNRLYDIAKFDSDLASTEYDKEFQRQARMAGIDINPSTGANIAATAAQGSQNMRQSSLVASLAAGGRFADWLNSPSGQSATNSAGDFFSGLIG